MVELIEMGEIGGKEEGREGGEKDDRIPSLFLRSVSGFSCLWLLYFCFYSFRRGVGLGHDTHTHITLTLIHTHTTHMLLPLLVPR